MTEQQKAFLDAYAWERYVDRAADKAGVSLDLVMFGWMRDPFFVACFRAANRHYQLMNGPRVPAPKE